MAFVIPNPEPAALALPRLRLMVEQLANPQAISPDAIEPYLKELSAYECWEPYLVLLEHCLTASSEGRLRSYVRMMRCQAVHLGRLPQAAKTCLRLISDLGLSYADLSLKVLPEALAEDDYQAEASILERVHEAFAHLNDRVSCLERLCLLYDKKLHNEQALKHFYEKILSLAPHNPKALRYFKVLFTQNGAWEDVARILRKMLATASHPEKVYRHAQELAGIYLYQLAQPHEAIQVLERHCSTSPLDTSTIHYDSYAQLGDWQGCLAVLKRCLAGVHEEQAQAVLHHRMGLLYLQLGQAPQAKASFSQASQIWPAFLEPVEELIQVIAAEQDWAELKRSLEYLLGLLQGEEPKQQIQSIVALLSEGLNEAAKNRRT